MWVGESAAKASQMSHADCRFGGGIIAGNLGLSHWCGENSTSDAWLRRSFVQLHEAHLPYRRNLRAVSVRALWSFKYRQVITQEFRGLSPMIWRDVLPHAIYMAVYDWTFNMGNRIAVVRDIRTQSHTRHAALALKLEALFTSLAALLASVLSWSLITPLDVVKTIMQAETNPNIHRNLLESFSMLLRAHNYRMLFSGIYMNIGKSFATLWGYQYCLNKCQSAVAKTNDDRLNKWAFHFEGAFVVFLYLLIAAVFLFAVPSRNGVEAMPIKV